ncbi:F-box protein At2g26850 isoform X1 [Physcomitrium patens]|uniref:F-box domain-containing protein n=1 Tax=Physcomitrium patens TaxID=3218 RepID=A0A2K1KFI4_PHYPA|nr:F-box protein At2g26850-like isoform X1 [Physcomitrium patens]XP_024377547.1 F-box protein At2g26850-like isoform X1 [Physcomitrium patens]XP_024377549.1 F-box protein At2g26850-like isoform X1 [Physcomitrium patens]XP_024377550.1 F-box protein At2g26850-like isoform X1 [Physcomitrium patens]XP_024377551.1 F-box protein At2g26850-like isoform X1 [Physcomitrium patens]PNR52546.1 hypothetical protein PHYPA_008920 [Physcomitrium patens]|eukprot:XP_024377546.1 F-box protein At2g26850-like isoform X1 [Physcomitrella patens]
MSLLSDWFALISSGSSLELHKIDKGKPQWRLGMMFYKRRCLKKVENVEDFPESMSVLDLPELALEGILGRLPPASLCQMAGVCQDLRKRCRSDHLWQNLFKEKWARIVGPLAFHEWQRQLTLQAELGAATERPPRPWGWPLSCLWRFSWLNIQGQPAAVPPLDSLMAWYWALESGSFWFPAQVYNREQNGHVGFMLSCYDAELNYDRITDSFKARYPPHGPRTIVIEEGVRWERLRAPPLDTPAHDLHQSDCLIELQPGDHVEVQWRRNKEFPYGWWYGVVGHSEACDGNSRHCRCHSIETVWLEFSQYTLGSRWRRAAINRKSHREEGNEAEGFYGGIRKLRTKEEINIWKRLWPTETLE